MTPMPTAGRFCWHELMTTDPAGAIAFYGKLAGWKAAAHPGDPTYQVLSARGSTRVGGVMELPQQARQMGSPSHWVPYIEVTDVDDTVRKATSMGGRTYVSPNDIPNMGRFAILADNQGATFAVYQGTNGISPDPEAGLGEFSWHEMIAGNLDSAWSFYHSLFGWEKREAMDMGADLGIYQIFRNAGGVRDLGGFYTKPKDMPAPPHWLSYITVPSAKKSGEYTTKNGGKVYMGPMEVPGGGWIVGGADPQGAAFATFEPPKAMKSPKAKPRKKPAKKKAKAKVKPKKKTAKRKKATKKTKKRR